MLVPVLICIGEHDRETTGDTTRELAARLPTSELRAYPCAHFDIYREDVRAAVIADQVEFLTRVVPLR